ncbi:o-methyltransferase family 3 [Diplodia corticola]|uniref:O-methyltransferase family 3 n=1 Tax=Diplodia corticola TaxID=236234 RepID=A0A1J9QVF4_9PEZI|nr:o-methyltransferase family 3 [Diplodia corticola]OJD32400.1 o-methyltransferase family 3 [Diplodia corticola]
MPSLLYSHWPKNLLLILLSFIFLPFDTFLFFAAYALRPFLRAASRKNGGANVTKDAITNGGGGHRGDNGGQTILVTGVSMTKALVLTRLLHAHNPSHRIIGADFHPLACGRASRSLSRFYVLSPPTAAGDADPYITSLLRVIGAERCALWISCSGVASALEDGVAAEVVAKRTRCRVVQFGVADVRDLHEKDAFMERTRRLALRVPETRKVESADAMVAALRRCVGLSARRREKEGGCGGRRFIAKSVGMDDKSRGDLTLLPRATERETREHVARLGVSKERPWIVQEFVRGHEFCTHALVVRGRVRAFLACPSAELLMHYRALPADSPLSRAMLAFTERQTEPGGEAFTGHLSFDFLVKDEDVEKTDPESIALYPIECNPRAHTADVLLDGSMELADEYLAVLRDDPSTKDIVTPKQPLKYYWVGHDLVQLFLLPVLSTLTGQAPVIETAKSVREFIEHILFWKDGTFEVWDPLPWWWLYHVYWPMQFVNSIRTGRKWSRINVSTTKMFDCN